MATATASRVAQRTLSSLKQGSTLSICSRVPKTLLKIIPEWREGGEISIDTSSHNCHPEMFVKHHEDQATSLGRKEAYVSVDIDSSSPECAGVVVIANVPEKCNLICSLPEGGDIHVGKKVEGDVNLSTQDGNIWLTKVRGYKIDLKANGLIYSSDLLEAQSINIQTPGRIRSKRIHGSNIHVERISTADEIPAIESVDTNDVDDDGAAIDISSLYISGEANLIVASAGEASQQQLAEKSIRCKSHHGHVNARADFGLVELGGASGSFDIHSSDRASVHVDACAPESMSVVTAKSNISLTLDRKLETDLRFVVAVGNKKVDDDGDDELSEVAREALMEDDDEAVAEGLAEFDQRMSAVGGPQVSLASSAISVFTSAFKEQEKPDDVTFKNLLYKRGHVTNESLEPDSRFERKMGSVGKIRIEGAASQALSGFVSSSSTSHDEKIRPLIVGACEGNITVESLSWLGSVARRYGMEENERPREIGRQASRRGRDLTPNE